MVLGGVSALTRDSKSMTLLYAFGAPEGKESGLVQGYGSGVAVCPAQDGDLLPWVQAWVPDFRDAHGPGYRVYFQKRGNTIIVLLCGGDKSTQDKDFKNAKRIAHEWSK
jgi:hypothetical protein